MKTLRIFFYTLTVLAAGDIATTLYGLHHGTEEANGAMRYVVQHPILFLGTKALWLSAGYVALRYVYRICIRTGRSLAYVFAPCSACVALYGWVICNNVSVLRSVL